MSRFNLLDEPWISVFDNESGERQDVSMIDLFRNADKYRSLAGEMETQNFAVMRMLLAVMQTVFSRFDIKGSILPGIELDDNWIQMHKVEDDDLEEYHIETEQCWNELYMSGIFPDIIISYLEKWKDHFYLFDDDQPFYQVNGSEMDEIMSRIPKKSQPSSIYGKNLNRTISESEHKFALFSPIANSSKGKRSNKDIMTAAEFARWLITFQGYSGLADKVSLVSAGQRPSKGWLFDIGGIFLRGETLQETLVLNYIPNWNNDFDGRIQRPCWERRGIDVVNGLCTGQNIDNLSELYTNWSRAVNINPDLDMSKPSEIDVVKIPEIDHSEHSIEPMTLWKNNNSGHNKEHPIPRKHSAETLLWRSFGTITLQNSNEDRRPGIFSQYERLLKVAGSRWTKLVGVGMEYGNHAASREPVNEISDSFVINDIVISDSDPDGWAIRISDVVENTKEVVSKIYGNFLWGICKVRNLKLDGNMAKGFVNQKIEEIYSEIDLAFKEWLASIKPGDSKEEKIIAWNEQLKKMILNKGEELFENSSSRDLTGIEKDDRVENIASKYWLFVNQVQKKLGKGGSKI